MRIDLKGWSSSGLRCPDVEVDLTLNGGIAPVSLIQMPNGTGKTTTLSLLMATLNGEAARWTEPTVRSFRRPGDDVAQGLFIVNLLVDGKPLTFELTLNYGDGHARYRTTSPGSGGVTAGWNPPPGVHRFLSKQFISLFVFDGEFADRLLDSGSAEAERAIDALCQLYLLSDISDFAERDWQQTTRRRGATTASGLANWQKARSDVLSRIGVLDQAQREAQGEVVELERRISELGELIGGHISRLHGVNVLHQKAMDDLSLAESLVSDATNHVMQSLRLPHALHPQIPTALLLLKGNLDRLKLPENTSAQFFQELLDEPVCICGREMTVDAQDQIRERARQYLGSDEAGVINALKRDIEQFTTASDEGSGYPRLASAVKRLNEGVRAQKEAEGKVRTLKQQLIDQGDEQVRAWEAELQEKKLRLGELTGLLKSISALGEEAEPTGETYSLALLRRRLTDLDRKIAEITQTVRLNEQTKIIQRIAAEARTVARDRLRALILSECNTLLRSVLSQDPLQIEKIDRSLHLASQGGASVGQTLSVGYTFLMSVLNRGQNQFPLIVDSPANPLDAGRRREVGKLIPALCSQFVGFTISTERLGFLNALEDTAEGKIKYITIFRKTDGTQHLLQELPGLAFHTDNAVIIEDRTYFHQFDLEEESE